MTSWSIKIDLQEVGCLDAGYLHIIQHRKVPREPQKFQVIEARPIRDGPAKLSDDEVTDPETFVVITGNRSREPSGDPLHALS